jgi:integrase
MRGVFWKNGGWWVDWRDAEHRRHRERVGPSKRAAEQALAQRKAEVLAGKFHLPGRRRPLLFADLAREYVAGVKATRAPTTFETVQSRVRPLIEFFGSRRVDQISAFDVERYTRQRIGGVTPRGGARSPSTVSQELVLLHSILAEACRCGLARQNPVVGARRLRAAPRARRILSHDEETRLLSVCGNTWLRAAVLLGLYGGLRRAEIAALTWADVDLAAGIVRVEYGKGGYRRDIQLGEGTCCKLAACRHDGLSETVVPGDTWVGRKQRLSSAFRKAVRRAGLNVGAREPLALHTLRRTYATRLDAAGVDLLTAQALLGHKSVLQTMIYVHPERSRTREAAALLEKSCAEAASAAENGHSVGTEAAGAVPFPADKP